MSLVAQPGLCPGLVTAPPLGAGGREKQQSGKAAKQQIEASGIGH